MVVQHFLFEVVRVEYDIPPDEERSLERWTELR
jgi:hypothetical protein